MPTYSGVIRRAAKIADGPNEGKYVILWDMYQVVLDCSFEPKEGDLIQFEPEEVNVETPAGGYIPDPDRPRAMFPVPPAGPEVERQVQTPGGYKRLGFKWLEIEGRRVVG